ncbi:unnamed protein product, partial [Effrenium voratum]
ETQTMRLMRTQVAKEWPGRRYDLIHCNCIHFCEELAQRLGVQPVPSWVRGLHETGAAAASVFRSFSKLLIDEPAQEVPNEQAPGATDSKAQKMAPKDQVRIIIETDSKTGLGRKQLLVPYNMTFGQLRQNLERREPNSAVPRMHVLTEGLIIAVEDHQLIGNISDGNHVGGQVSIAFDTQDTKLVGK